MRHVPDSPLVVGEAGGRWYLVLVLSQAAAVVVVVAAVAGVVGIF